MSYSEKVTDDTVQNDHTNDNLIETSSISSVPETSTDTSSSQKCEDVNEETSSDNESLRSKDVESESNEKLTDVLAFHQKVINEKIQTIKCLEEKLMKSERLAKDYQLKLDQALKEKDAAVKQKEMIVVSFAVAEKNVLKEKYQKDQAEKKYKEAHRENEFLQHKVQTMISEKGRICQMLDNKCHEYKNVHQELEHMKADLSSLETKLKWSQNSLKSEIENHKETQTKLESANIKLLETTNLIEHTQKEAEASIKSYHHSEENRAHTLDKQLQGQQATLILLKHENKDKEEQLKILQNELQRLQSKQKEMILENNDLSLKVQQLEKDRSESEQKLSELRGCADQQRQDSADLQSKTAQLEQLKLQLKHEQDQLMASNEQMVLLKQRNVELESDMETCRQREAELLLFTQQLTDKNVRLQSEFTSRETKIQQLSSEYTSLKRQIKEAESKICMLSSKLSDEGQRFKQENDDLSNKLVEVTKAYDQCKQQVTDMKGEETLMKRKYEMSLKEMNKELHYCRRKLDDYEKPRSKSSNNSSSSSLNTTDSAGLVKTDVQIDKETLIEHIVNIQKVSAKKSDKIDFLEEHVNTLVADIQKKTKLLQSYILREQSGALTSNKMDRNKADFSKFNGLMASLYTSRVTDESVTLELSLDVNRKLQAVLEDTLLKNITLKENVDTLASEIDRMNKMLKQ
ncbi:unnamed protein product [Phaedon cochleariae]|uniref:Coiled-coil domain-containing protein 186 n=1 Tax=Phaedon cochleariae TaxID=80249 RepID=A0A9P0DHK6_PHACE|nr:unnamed protein product [Phaedon cochleariae]